MTKLLLNMTLLFIIMTKQWRVIIVHQHDKVSTQHDTVIHHPHDRAIIQLSTTVLFTIIITNPSLNTTRYCDPSTS